MNAMGQTARAVGVAGLLLTMLLGGAPGARAATRAVLSPRASPQSLALREAVSPATGHLFVLSQELSGVVPSAVSMLDARTGRIEHVTPVGHYARWLLVDDATHQVFVVNGGVSMPDQVPESVGVVVLDSRSGALLRTIDLGPGEVQQVKLAGRLDQLYVVITPAATATAAAPGVVRILDTKTGTTVHTLALQNGDNDGMVHQATHTAFVLNAAGAVRLYDTRTWKLKATVHLEQPEAGVADETHGAVALVTGKLHTTITFVNPVTGAVSGTITLKDSPQIVNMVLDDQTDHLFAVSVGEAAKAEQVTEAGVTISGGTDGAVTTIGRASHVILRTQPVGFAARQAAIDGSLHRLFVLSAGSVGKNHGRVTIASSLVSMLDTRTGALVGATKLAFTDVIDLADIAVDAQAGRAYVNAATGPANPNSVTILDSRTGAVVQTVVLLDPEM